MCQNFFLPSGAVDMCVNLRGEDIFMPEHLLHSPEVCTALHQMRSERMPERMRGNFLSNPRRQSLLLDHVENRNTAQLSA